jgi:hypothetical protein
MRPSEKTNRKKETIMKTILTAERNVRKVVFTSLWKFFEVKDITDLSMLGIVSTLGAVGMWLFVKALINWL